MSNKPKKRPSIEIKCSSPCPSSTNEFHLDSRLYVKNLNIHIEVSDLEQIRVLGKGQYVVNEMKHKPTGHRFAVKKIGIDALRNTDDREADIKDVMDIKVAENVGESPYLVNYYGALEENGYYWIFTEKMDISLDQFFTKIHNCNPKNKINESFYSKIAFSVLNALIRLDEKNYMHRDIKPHNILLNLNVCDFGVSGRISRDANGNGLARTQGRGSFSFMAPEKIAQKNVEESKGYSVKSDVWSLGISLIYMIEGRHPFPNCHDFTGEELICKSTPPKLNPSQCSNYLCDFVDKCLIKDEESRPWPRQLIDHSFIQNHISDLVDLKFVKCVIDLTAEDSVRKKNLNE